MQNGKKKNFGSKGKILQYFIKYREKSSSLFQKKKHLFWLRPVGQGGLPPPPSVSGLVRNL